MDLDISDMSVVAPKLFCGRIASGVNTVTTCPSPRAPRPWSHRPRYEPWRNLPPEYPRRGGDRPHISCGALEWDRGWSTRHPPPSFCIQYSQYPPNGSLRPLWPRFLCCENLVQVAHGADVRIAGIAAPDARRIGHHGFQFLPHYGLRIG